MDDGTHIPPTNKPPDEDNADSEIRMYNLRLKRPRVDNDGFIKPSSKQTARQTHKKPASSTSTSNQFDNLNDKDDMMSVYSQNSTPTSKRASSINDRPKPVFVNSGIVALKNSLVNVSFSSQPLLKMINSTKTQVSCASSEDKTKLIEKLKAVQFYFHTFTEPHQKALMFVLKGHHHVSCEELKAELDEAAVPTSKVTFLLDHAERPLYVIHFARGTTNLHSLNTMAKAVGNVIVKWHRFDQSKKRLTQCHNCQQFGHSSTNCGYKYRCIKCLNDHLPGQCLRKTKDDEGTPKCVNCQGDHSANSRQCQHYITYSEMVQRRRTTRQTSTSNFVSNRQHRGLPAQQASPAAAVASLNRANFPNLPHNSNSRNVSGNLNGLNSESPTFPKISSLQARLAAIPDIAEVLIKFEALVLRLESAKTIDEKVQILLTLGASNNGN